MYRPAWGWRSWERSVQSAAAHRKSLKARLRRLPTLRLRRAAPRHAEALEDELAYWRRVRSERSDEILEQDSRIAELERDSRIRF